MALQANALISVADLKGFLTIEEAKTEYDSDLESLVNELSDLFDSVTHRNLKAEDRTEYRDGDGSDTLYLRDWPVNEATSSVLVYIDFDREYGADTLIPQEDMIVDEVTGRVVLTNGVFPCWPQVAKVVYNAGYSTVPGDLRVAIKEACAFFRKRGKTGAIGVSSVSTGPGGNVTYLETDLPKTVQTILARYTRAL